MHISRLYRMLYNSMLLNNLTNIIYRSEQYSATRLLLKEFMSRKFFLFNLSPTHGGNKRYFVVFTKKLIRQSVFVVHRQPR